ncbi:MAG TPA: hypothetical protein VMT62_03685 [Syntrophorhabdaceae bacterium]|nr:hypothetical protein [Syntrophorhabdaceae bacterium]
MGAYAVGGAFVSMFFALLFFVISIVIMRWAFRINHIVERLDKIVDLMSINAGIRRE